MTIIKLLECSDVRLTADRKDPDDHQEARFRIRKTTLVGTLLWIWTGGRYGQCPYATEVAVNHPASYAEEEPRG